MTYVLYIILFYLINPEILLSPTLKWYGSVGTWVISSVGMSPKLFAGIWIHNQPLFFCFLVAQPITVYIPFWKKHQSLVFTSNYKLVMTTKIWCFGKFKAKLQKLPSFYTKETLFQGPSMIGVMCGSDIVLPQPSWCAPFTPPNSLTGLASSRWFSPNYSIKPSSQFFTWFLRG